MEKMRMNYKRIGKGLTSYSLYPENVNIEDIITNNGQDNDYYQSIFKYKKHHYEKFITNLQDACSYLNLPFKEENAINLTGKVLYSLKKKAEEGDAKAKTLRENVSVSGTSDVFTTKLVFDFDDSNDLSKAKSDTLEMYNRLKSAGLKKENIQVCFSGNKGFSIEVTTDEKFNQSEFENMVTQFAIGLKTFDSKVKDPQRLFRLPLTRHNKSKLYKTPIDPDKLTKMETKDILNQAREISETHWNIFDSWERVKKLPTEIKSLSVKKEEHKKESPKVETEKLFLDMSNKPSWLSEARYVLQEGYFKRGSRNEAMMILASTYKQNGMDKMQAAALLDVTAAKQAAINGDPIKSSEEIEREVLDVVYSSSWKGGIYSEETNALLLGIIEQYGLRKYNADKGAYTLDDMKKRFNDFAINIDKNTIKTGIKKLDEEVLITTGMLVSLLGSASSGKSSVCLNLLRNVSKSGEKAIFFSLDMPDNLIFARLTQMFLDKPKAVKDLLDDIKIGKTDDMEKAFLKMKEEFNNVQFQTKSGTSITDIRNKLQNYKDIHGDTPKLVVVDYLEKVFTDISDPTQASGYIASSLADIARDFNCCVLLLVQPQKSAGDPSEPLLSMRKIKGSSRLEQDSRIVLTLWRPGFNPENNSRDKFISMAVVKNNMGSVGQFDFTWNGPNGAIDELDYQGRLQLKQLLEEKAAEKNKEFEI